jgi:EmrB/QacA subfamily drug resistance transporter
MICRIPRGLTENVRNEKNHGKSSGVTKRIAAGEPVRVNDTRSALALAVILACQAMVVLDGTIMNVGLPRIQDELDLSTGGLSWVVNAYTLAFGGMLLVGGRAGDLLGRRRVLIAGLTLFTVAAAVGGAAPDAGWLIGARAVMGVGAAVAAPTALGLIATTFAEGPPRTQALSVFAVVSSASMTVGGVVSGLLIELSWRSLLWVNVPIGLAALLAAPFVLRESPRAAGRFDASGALLSALAPALLVYGFIEVSARGWRDPVTVGSFAAAIVLLAAFAWVESRAQQPIMPLRLFADRDRAGAYLIRFLITAAMSGFMFFVPLYLQNILRVSPFVTGLSLLPGTIVLIFANRITNRLLSRFGRKTIMVAAATITFAGMLWLTTISPNSGYFSTIAPAMVMVSLGVGLLFVMLTLVVLARVPTGDAGAASGVLQSMQQIGGSLGLAVQVTAFQQVTAGTTDVLPGYRLAFLLGTAFCLLLLGIAVFMVRARRHRVPELHT